MIRYTLFTGEFLFGSIASQALNALASGAQSWMTWAVTVCTSLLGLLMLFALARFVISQR